MARLTGTGIRFDLTDPNDSINSYYWLYPQGTQKLFYQSSAPTGWTQVTNAVADGQVRSINNLALRVVNNATTGGSWGTGGVEGQVGQKFSTIFGGTSPNISQTYSGTFPVSFPNTVTSNVGNRTLSVSNLPNHAHGSTIGPLGGSNSTPFSNVGARLRRGSVSTSGMIQSTGGGAHKHPFSGSVTLTNIVNTSNIDMALRYVDVIICKLN